MIPESQVLSVRLLCLMIAACGVYCLALRQKAQIGNVFQRFTLTATASRVLGIGSLALAVVLFLLTL